jgi:anti-anti-sigma regulatory factor
MDIGIKKNAKENVIEVSGRLDTTTAPLLDKVIDTFFLTPIRFTS